MVIFIKKQETYTVRIVRQRLNGSVGAILDLRPLMLFDFLKQVVLLIIVLMHNYEKNSWHFYYSSKCEAIFGAYSIYY